MNIRRATALLILAGYAPMTEARPVQRAPLPLPTQGDLKMQTTRLELSDGTTWIVHAPEQVSPLQPFSIRVEPPGENLTLREGNSEQAIPSSGRIKWRLSGPEGPRTFVLSRDGRPLGRWSILLRARSHFEAPGFDGIFELLRDTVSQYRRKWSRGDRAFIMNHPWLRDNIHKMKGCKYWDPEMSAFVDMFLDMQHEEGFFYEIIGGADHNHLPLVGEKHKRVEAEHDLAWIRLEIEADIEYLMVEAAHTLWQITGDAEAMKARLPGLTRGLEYMTSHPSRWDEEHQLVKRTFTIDTWDFTYGIPDYRTNRRIEPHMPMCIFHGDNSGLYQACAQLARMWDAAGDAPQAGRWRRTAGEIRQRTNSLCFNGQFYTHQIHLTPVETGVDEEGILSLSNTYNINRGLPTPDMARAIIDTYRQRRDQLPERPDPRPFAEWFSIDPPYPRFGDYRPGEYINGGIASFVAGELALAALTHDRERYGADILRRVVAKMREDGALYFLYTPDGSNQGGGPSGWGAAAVLAAMMEGLAGIVDDDVLFRKTTVSPRFAAAEIDQARVCARYGPSGAYMALDYQHNPSNKSIRIALAGVAEEVTLRVLLPAGAEQPEVVTPAGLPTSTESGNESMYLVIPVKEDLSGQIVEIVIRYT